MSVLSPQVQTIVATFGQRHGVTQDNLNNLQAVLNSSPALIDQINDAVAQGHLKSIMPLTNRNAGGQYNPDPNKLAMELPLAKLTTPPPGPQQRDQIKLNLGEVTFVLGHELQHGFNRIATKQALTDFANDAGKIAKNAPAPRNYTAPTAALLAQKRRDEAGAEIAGWNAIVSRVKSTNPNPQLQDIYDVQPGRMVDFIDRNGNYPSYTHTLKPNLTLNADLTLSATPANVEAMGQNYFDKPAKQPGGLGPLGNSDYVNYYGRSPVSFVTQIERHYHPHRPGVTAPQMGLNLSQLRLNEKLLEENGINLGSNQQPIPYYDSSKSPPTAHLFQHTIDTHKHVNPIAAQVFEAELARARTTAVPSPADPSHPNHAMLEQIRVGIRAMDDKIGKNYDDDSERISRSVLAACKDNREMYPNAGGISLSANALNRVDHVLMGGTGNVFAIEGKLDDPAHKRIFVPVEQAIRTPVEQSDQKLLTANQAIALEQATAQQQELTRGLDNTSCSGPAMR